MLPVMVAKRVGTRNLVCFSMDGTVTKGAGCTVNTEVRGNDTLTSDFVPAGLQPNLNHTVTKGGEDLKNLTDSGI
jgi:hypothetical protein